GKSTFIKILIGLLDPSEGRILINDMELSKDDRLNLFATSFQTSKLFAGSVRDNIPSDKINLNFLKEYISEYNLGFNIDEFLEKKIGDQFYDNAYKPSGGMEQAIISLRLFLSENPFLVFDEPTSALDIDKELKFYERLKKTSDRGYLIVSHRLSLSNAVDKIIVINNRTIEAFGDYDQLIEKSSYFKELNEEFKKIFNGEDYV
uniref:ATP-binding cassette domain-containing protein n=1 Tax=uncultured Anaerococcus sp. TaxID=293428 RepID=UPI0025CD25AC